MQKFIILLRRLRFLLLDSIATSGWKMTLKRIAHYAFNFYRIKSLAFPSHFQDYESYLKEEHLLFEINPKAQADLLENGPLISIILPTYNTPPHLLHACVESVLSQTYPNWELCLYDDASTLASTLSCIRQWEGHSKIKIKFGQKNGHISSASNQAVAMASGQFVALLDHDDLMSKHALMEVCRVLKHHPDTDFVYSDEDHLNEQGERVMPYFKSGFNPALLCSNNYITHLSVIKKAAGDAVGWFRQGFEGAQDHDLFLRLMANGASIRHIPKVLYHWRMVAGSTALAHNEKNYAEAAGKRAIADYFDQKGAKVEVSSGGWKGCYIVKHKLNKTPLVSVMVPFKDELKLLKQCVNGLLNGTDYPNFEVLLINNNSQEKATLDYLAQWRATNERVRVIDYSLPFNFSAINNFAATFAQGDYLLLLNNDTQPIYSNWLTEMMSYAIEPENGAVGAALRYADDTWQHYGVILGINGTAGHAYKQFPALEFRHYQQGCVRNVSAVTGACMLTSKADYQNLGGLDETHFPIALNDIDYCLRLQAAGKRIVFTPHAELYHYESKSRGYEDTPEKRARYAQERAHFMSKWSEIVNNDPYYNPNLTLTAENYSIRQPIFS